MLVVMRRSSAVRFHDTCSLDKLVPSVLEHMEVHDITSRSVRCDMMSSPLAWLIRLGQGKLRSTSSFSDIGLPDSVVFSVLSLC